MGGGQIKELISAAKCTVFFIDGDQRVTLNDIGTKAEIQRFAEGKGVTASTLGLSCQFRCGGSDGYLAWLDNILDVRVAANTTLTPDEFDFQVFDSPEALHEAIKKKNEKKPCKSRRWVLLALAQQERPVSFRYQDRRKLPETVESRIGR